VELIAHNEKGRGIDLRVVQAFGGRWKIVSASQPHVRLDAGSAQWRVTVPASGNATLRYAVDLSE
jgi:hypothetical protein